MITKYGKYGFALASLVFAAAACGSSESGTPAANLTACQRDTRAESFSPGMERVAAGVAVRLLDASPSPPNKGQNVWTMQVMDAAGAPVNDATVTLTPFMPDHGHGSAQVPLATATGQNGQYAITNLYLPMAGFWQITVVVTLASGQSHEAKYGFCLDG